MLFPAPLPRFARVVLFCALAWVCVAGTARASIGLVVGEPFGAFGTVMPEGHAGVYLDHICAETPTTLRPCAPGEPGVVLSRYHDLRKPALDWLAFPATTFFYGGDSPSDLPNYITSAFEAALRERYWREHLREVLPGRRTPQGDLLPPRSGGDWAEGIGAAFDRRLLVYVVDTTPAQDATLIQMLNQRPNRRRYTLGRANCADFAADLLRQVVPASALRRNVLADFDMTTPKNLAREIDAYGTAHPELHLRVLEVAQLPGSLRRSRPLRGAAESFLTTKRYLATLLVIQPEAVLGCWAAYEKRGKWTPGLDAVAVVPGEWPAPVLAVEAGSAGGGTLGVGDASESESTTAPLQ